MENGMTSRFVFIASVLMIGQSAFAGANNAVLECKSGSGRTTLKAEYPVDLMTAAAVVTVDGKSLTYVNEEKVEDAQMNNEDLNKEYPGYVVKQFQATQDKKNVALWVGMDSGKKFDENDLVMTSTGTVVRTKIPNGFSLKFNATLDGVDPRNEAISLPQITVSCTMKYQI
jgi:hypothetical protein